MKKKRISIIIALVVTTSIIPMPVYGTPSGSDTTKPPTNATASPNTSDSEKTNDEVKNDLAKFEKEISDRNKEMYKLNTDIETLMEQKKSNEGKVEEINKEMEALQEEIDKYNPQIKDKQVVLGKRIRELYKTGSGASYLSAFSGTESIEDFLSRMDSVSVVLGVDRKAMKDLSESQKKLKEKLKGLEQKKSEVNKIELQIKKDMKIIENKKNDYNKFINDNQDIMNKLLQEKPEVLAEFEIKTVQSQIDTINTSEDYYTIKAAVDQLTAVLNANPCSIKSPSVLATINEHINKGNDKLAAIDKANSVETIGQNILGTAYGYLGYPYVWGAKGPNAFDCSGFVQYVYGLNGYSISGSTYTQINDGVQVGYNELMPGDIVFTRSLEHVGIYIGGGQYIHAANPVQGVMISAIAYDGFYAAIRVY